MYHLGITDRIKLKVSWPSYRKAFRLTNITCNSIAAALFLNNRMLVFDRFVLNLPIVFCLISSCLACFALQQQSVRPALIETTGFNQNNNQTEKKKNRKKTYRRMCWKLPFSVTTSSDMVDVDMYMLVNFQQTGEKRGRETGFFWQKKILFFFLREFTLSLVSQIFVRIKNENRGQGFLHLHASPRPGKRPTSELETRALCNHWRFPIWDILSHSKSPEYIHLGLWLSTFARDFWEFLHTNPSDTKKFTSRREISQQASRR